MTDAAAFIASQLKRGSLGHAYLIETETAGEALLGRLARLIQCEEGSGCGSCPSCRAFDSGNHPDIITLRRAKEDYGVEEVRSQLADDMGIRPYRFPRKVYLIPEAERLSDKCQNALLKTLEEPPAYGVILMAAPGRSSFLPTVLSRLTLLRARGEESPKPAGEGEGREWLLGILRRMEYLDMGEILSLSDGMKQAGLGDEDALRIWEQYGRDLMLAAAGGEGFSYPEAAHQIKEQAGRLTDETLKGLWREIALARDRIRSHVNSAFVWEILCLYFRQVLIESKEN